MVVYCMYTDFILILCWITSPYNLYLLWTCVITGQDTELSLFVSHYKAGKFSSRLFDENLVKHDAFLIVDRFIFVQVSVNMHPSLCAHTHTHTIILCTHATLCPCMHAHTRVHVHPHTCTHTCTHIFPTCVLIYFLLVYGSVISRAINTATIPYMELKTVQKYAKCIHSSNAY